MNPIILIPARMQSTRLPNKPLALIAGEPMIVHVWRRAVAAKIGEVLVACDSQEIADAITKVGGKAILTDPDLPSGSDRIYQAITKYDSEKKFDAVINVQGDMPALDPKIIKDALALLQNADIGTLAASLQPGEENDPAVVKVRIQDSGFRLQEEKNNLISPEARNLKPETFTAFTFSRTYMPGSYHHIGIYAYRRAALEKFVSLAPSENEKREKLEQLRAMDNGMRIDVAIVDTVPLGVDTPEGLDKARKILG